MKIVIAPDSFKGSMSARNVCLAVKKGILRVFPRANVVEVPLADGGEGTVESMVYASTGSIREVEVKDPLGRSVIAAYGVLGDGKTAVIEIAQASGLPLVAEAERNPLITTSYGTGQLILHALDQGYRKFIIGLGGSATNDAGVGMLKALGVKFYDQNGNEISKGGGLLSELAYFDDSGMDSRLNESVFMVASDVTNPLCGYNGASAVFGPQKGATSEMIKTLDQALKRFADIVYKQLGADVRGLPGAGAAGGMGAALMSFLNGRFISGVEIIMEVVGLEEKLKDADLVITGEGRLDSQTLSGKVISGVCKLARKHRIPVIALCGTTKIAGEQMDGLELEAAFPLVPGPCRLTDAMENGPIWAADRTEQVMRLMKISKRVRSIEA